MLKSHKELIVWQRSMDLVESIYKISSKLPGSEQFGLVSQMRRAGVSIPSNIAEGYGREGKGNYIQFLSIAKGSLLELETQIELCVRLKYIQVKEAEVIQNLFEEVGKMIGAMIRNLKAGYRS